MKLRLNFASKPNTLVCVFDGITTETKTTKRKHEFVMCALANAVPREKLHLIKEIEINDGHNLIGHRIEKAAALAFQMMLGSKIILLKEEA